MTVEENSFAHNDGPGWIGTEGGYRVVGVMIIKSGKEDFSLIVLVITVRILKEYQASTLGNIDAIMGNFETDGNVQVVGKVGLFIRFPVVVGIFKNDQLVLRKRIANPIVGITGHGGHP